MLIACPDCMPWQCDICKETFLAEQMEYCGSQYQCKDGANCEQRLMNPPKRQRKMMGKPWSP